MADLLVVMGVNPGWGGQPFIESTPERVKAARELANRLHPTLDIEVDGGVNLETGRKVSTAGATVLVAGHFTFSHPEGARAAIAELHAL
jgi:ribulose-phosphate 3-epimerase